MMDETDPPNASSAYRLLSSRWTHGLSSRIGVICGAVKQLRCTEAELVEYAAYITQARLVGFLSAEMAEEAWTWIEAAERLFPDGIAPCNSSTVDTPP